MNATHTDNFFPNETPLFNKKSHIFILGSVLALHSLVAIGLSNLKIADIKPTKTTPPLDIAFILPPPADTVEPIVNPEMVPEVQSKSQPTPEPLLKPVTSPQPKPKLEPVVPSQTKPNTIVEKPQANKDPIKKPIEKQIQQPQPSIKKTLPEKIISTQTNSEQNTIISQQTAEKAEPNQNQPKMNAQSQQEITEKNALAEQQVHERKQAEANIAHQQALAKTKVKQEADDKTKAEQAKQQQAKLAQDKKDKDLNDKKTAQIQNNTSVTFSVGQSSWRNKPSFSCDKEEDETRIFTTMFRYTVDKQGNATVVISKSSGNNGVDSQLLKQAKSAKFHPYIKNGVPVVGIVYVPGQC